MIRLLFLAIAGIVFTALGASETAGAAPAPPSFSATAIDDAMDLHGDPCNAQLVIFAGGNQWMVMPALLAAFRESHPGLDRIFYETLPPGILSKQLTSGSLSVGQLSLSAAPDVYMAGARNMHDVLGRGLVGAPITYATNSLAIAVRKGNPKHVVSLKDLGRPDVRVAMPNPAWEGIARQIQAAYRKAGGDALDTEIMVTKVRDGTTLLTQIHHRQTPMWLIDGRADAGPVWISEALYQQRIGAPIETVTIPATGNMQGMYQAAAVTHAPHPEMARAFVEFLAGPKAREIYRAYGFGPPAMLDSDISHDSSVPFARYDRKE